MAKADQVYKPKALIDGRSIGLEAGSQWVAVPDKFAGRKVTVSYHGVDMTIKDWAKEATMFRRFRDRFWRADSGRSQFYTLGYFPFKPDSGME
jgi:hypothetical protein